MSLKTSCPACGAEMVFRSKATVFAVCAYCRSTVVRHDIDVETLGKMAELTADMSPLQVGTRGKFRGVAFQILGRVRQVWEDGNWNEWFAAFENGREGWIAEAQGDYMVNFSAPANSGIIPKRDQVSIGTMIRLGPKGDPYEVTDIRDVTCEGSDGELPFACPKGRKSRSVDLTGDDSRFACIDYSDEGDSVYLGTFARFEDLSFSGLRVIDGWA